MSDSGRSSKTIAGLRHGLFIHRMLVDIVLVRKKVSKVVVICCVLGRIQEDQE
jgi:hypothetical protein